MMPLPLSRIALWTNGRLLANGAPADMLIDAVETDTRTLDASDGRAALFIALKGANFDGHDHVAAAAEQGARAALVSREVDAPLPQVLVADTERALAALAAALQHARSGKVVGITGSNGKTSVKQMTLAILSQAMKACANPGNRNNEIGLPLAVIDAPDDADVAIYEMGAGKHNDIAYLTAIVRPDVSLVNNIAPAHLERMQSLLGIADTKAAIYDALPHDGVAVINADDAFAPYFAGRAQGRRLIRYGLEASADVSARDIQLEDDGSRFVLVAPTGEAVVSLPLPGRHNIANALAAASIALALDVPLATIALALSNAEPVKGRLVRHRLGNGATLIDDSYNANPGSLNAAIDTLAAASGENWLVLGDMRELGEDAVALHAEAGRRAQRAGIARLYALGPLSAAAAEAFGEGARHFDSHEALVDALRVDLHSGVRMLVKGSRGSAMDRIVDALLPRDTGDDDAA
ncbi:MAG TPA: UDP-N-acetylmuramoyl-tripeptide--D-alanyl-D-alanine ligase [Luteimonas sp.]|nr:UDP-N-acetylmuramoyl-tripeptide--D-alanyl-D-alanine ligase [Luteimonas sp.]HRO28326.1 UDP-N-acetylmuramoyl-tripeptide--D-alanyl-D-alanine ligase [Luteimonas sp.]HRP71915.1 UDP-N-acetylmuramoyl-tripeptide--D-alanyl-D-alanine ligase [Luteimonas sp.]